MENISNNMSSLKINNILSDKILLLNNTEFSNWDTNNLVSCIENILIKNKERLNINNYYLACSMIGYYFGKTHNYDKSQIWLNKVSDKRIDWYLFKELIFPVMMESEEEEKLFIKKLKESLDNLINNIKLININNLLLLDHSFWYGYLKHNPIEIYKKYAQLQSKVFPSISYRNLVNYNIKNDRIKLGIITNSLDRKDKLNICRIHSSSISDSFYSTFLNLPKDKFEVIYIHVEDGLTKCKQGTDYLCIPSSLGLENIKYCQEKIASLNLDIILYIDLHIKPIMNFIALSKVAKIQICTHGHPVTSGMPRDIMNYFISWEAAEIDNAQDHYTEELVLITKDIIWEYYTPRNSNGISMISGKKWDNFKRQDLKFLPNDIDFDKNWYFCAQATFKLNYMFDDILNGILQKDDNAIIFLIENDSQLYNLKSLFIKRLKKKNIDVNRIIFLRRLSHNDMMSLYNNIDVVLDSFFFGGDTTTREAFECGSPIITLPYKYLGCRWTQAYYKFIGVTELIAKDIENYIELAVSVGTNKVYSSQLKKKIKDNSHKLFYSKESSKLWGDVFEKLYNKHQDNYIIKEKNIENKIPKIIIQTWKNCNMNPKLQILSDKIKKLHPDFEYKFFTDEDIENFVKSYYSEYYHIYNNFKFTIQKIDFFRYLAVYYYGGFYLDMDMDINSPFDELCKYNSVFPKETNHLINNKIIRIANYSFGACKNNKFLKFCIDNIVNKTFYMNIDNMQKEQYVYITTGPAFLSISYHLYKNKEDINILNYKEYCFGKYGTHIAMGSWKDIDTEKIEDMYNDKDNSELTPKGGTELMMERIKERVNISKINLITKNVHHKINNNNEILYWLHDLPQEPGYKYLNKNKNFVFVSNYQRELFIQYFNLNPSLCNVIRNGIIPIPRKEKNNSICRLIYHSTPNRGLDILVVVFSKLITFFNNIGITIHLDVYSSFNIYARSDLDQNYLELFNNIKNHPNMTYHGTVSNQEIREALSNSHIFAFPSTHVETSCLCLIEAMSAGCLCVHSSLGALPETANDYTLMYKYTDNKLEHCTIFAETLIKAVTMYTNISLDDQIEYINNTFNINKIAEEWKSLIKKIHGTCEINI